MESAPKNSFNSEPNEPNKPSDNKESSKKFTPWSPGQSPGRRIEHASGASLPESEKRLPFRQFGERSSDNSSEKADRDSMGMFRPEQSGTSHPAAEDLGSTATREEREQLDDFFHAHESEVSVDKSKTPDKDDASLPAVRKLPVAPREESRQAAKNLEESKDVSSTPNEAREKPAERDAFQEFVESHKELADLSQEALADTPVGVGDAGETPTVEATGTTSPDAAFEEFAKHHQEADMSVDSVKDQDAFQDFVSGHPEVGNDRAEQDAFKDFVQNHGELADLSAEAISMDPVVIASAEGPSLSDNDAFRELVMNEGAPDPGSNAWREGEPGTPPTAEGGDMPPRPPFPPTAEGGAYDNSEPGRFGEQYPSNPNLAQNPWATAGDLLDPATLVGLSALEAQQQLNSLRHTAREAGLAGAVGILGLGLIFEHFGAKRRHKRNQRQIKAQGKELAQTNKTLQEEQAAHLRTHEELQRLKREHTTTSERLHDVQTRTMPKLETAAGVGVVGALAATEIADRAAQKKAEIQSKELADSTVAGAMTENLATTLRQQQEVVRGLSATPELTEAAAATVYANTVRQEMRHERLQDKLADTGGVSGTTVSSRQNSQSGMPAMLPPVMGVGTTDQPSVSPAEERAKQKHAMHIASGWTWAIIGLIIVAVAAALFG